MMHKDGKSGTFFALEWWSSFRFPIASHDFFLAKFDDKIAPSDTPIQILTN